MAWLHQIKWLEESIWHKNLFYKLEYNRSKILIHQILSIPLISLLIHNFFWWLFVTLSLYFENFFLWHSPLHPLFFLFFLFRCIYAFFFEQLPNIILDINGYGWKSVEIINFSNIFGRMNHLVLIIRGVKVYACRPHSIVDACLLIIKIYRFFRTFTLRKGLFLLVYLLLMAL